MSNDTFNVFFYSLYLICVCFFFLYTEIFETVRLESVEEELEEHLAAEVEQKYRHFLLKSGQGGLASKTEEVSKNSES